jgi:CheY-like chemotaxis protein
MNNLPVFIVDEDEDDQFLINEVWKELELKNPLKSFTNGEELIKEMKSENTNPLIIISDVNLTKMDGFKLRQKLRNDSSMNGRSIPFVFWSAQATKQQIEKAYELSVHGFFIKDDDFEKMKETFKKIIEYWLESKSPEKI